MNLSHLFILYCSD